MIMHRVKIEWAPAEAGGRRSIPPGGRFFSVSRFPEDNSWQDNAWSVVFELENPLKEDGKIISLGPVRFLMDNAPYERMDKHPSIEIYEGASKVGDVYFI